MVTFDPPALQKQLAAAIVKLDDAIFYDWLPVDHTAFNPAEYDDEVVTAKTEVACHLASDQEGDQPVTVGDLINWADALGRFKLKERTVLRMDTRTLVHVEPRDRMSLALAEAITGGKVSVTSDVLVDGSPFHVELVNGFTIFAVFIEAEGQNNEHLPSFHPSTMFVQIDHPEQASDDQIKGVADAFLFELECSAAISLTRRPYPVIEDWDEIDDNATPPTITLRPLTTGPGLADLHHLFVEGCAASPAEYALIHFVKIVEYVSATVVRMARHEALRRRLSSKTALAPTTAFLDDLAELIEAQRIFTKDSEAIKVTLQTCCDAVLLAMAAPRSLSTLRAVTESSDPKQKRAALDELSACLSATRNQLSHAKANYTLTGAECPAEDLQDLTSCALVAAQQVIRWFARVPTDSRVT